MEMRLVIFLMFTFVVVVTNTLMIWFAYKGFAGVVARVTETVREFETSDSTRAVLNSVQAASEHAVKITELAKEKLASYEPVVDRASQDWGSALARMDAKFENIEGDISENVRKVRDAVAEPAYKIEAVAAGIYSVLSYINPDGGK